MRNIYSRLGGDGIATSGGYFTLFCGGGLDGNAPPGGGGGGGGGPPIIGGGGGGGGGGGIVNAVLRIMFAQQFNARGVYVQEADDHRRVVFKIISTDACQRTYSLLCRTLMGRLP